MRFIKYIPMGFNRLYVMAAVLACCMALTGCLSHWFIDSTTRLQVENSTEDCTLLGLDVVSEDSTYKTWIDETVLPGERSRVVEEDWVGDFTLRIRYTKSADGKGDVLTSTESLNLEGGSLYLVIKTDGDSLVWKFK